LTADEVIAKFHYFLFIFYWTRFIWQ